MTSGWKNVAISLDVCKTNSVAWMEFFKKYFVTIGFILITLVNSFAIIVATINEDSRTVNNLGAVVVLLSMCVVGGFALDLWKNDKFKI